MSDEAVATTSSSPKRGSDSDVDNGEFALLLESYDDDYVVPLENKVIVVSVSGSDVGAILEEQEEKNDAEVPPMKPQKRSSSLLKRRFDLTSFKGESVYGKPLSTVEAIEEFPPSDGGLEWKSIIIPDKFITDDNKLCTKALNPRDFLLDKGEIKPRRPTLPVTQSDFFGSLTKVTDDDGTTRYIFNGVLNGWPSLKCLELISLEKKRHCAEVLSPIAFLQKVAQKMQQGKGEWISTWEKDKEGKDNIHPKDTLDDDKQTIIYRAHLRSPGWSSEGWSMTSPGYVFWYESIKPIPKMTFGTNILDEVDDANSKCTNLYMMSHRYAVKKEKLKDQLTYHSIVLLEWDHGKYMSLIEGAFVNGLGGYNGRANWYDDKDNKNGTTLYKSMPSEMIGPWLTTAAEIRCHDLPCKNLDEFKQFVNKYTVEKNDTVGGGRFVDVHYHFEHKCRITYRTKQNIAQYLINYIRRDNKYSELRRNCQTLAADLAAFLAGKKNVTPFHPINKIEYQNRTHLFLYDSELY